MQIFDWTR